MNNLINKVLTWAKYRNLLDSKFASQQLNKIIEELGETSSAFLRGNTQDLKDGIGDIMVTLIIFAAQNGMSIEECLETAYTEIKDRKGKIVNNTFIKDLEK